MLSLEEKKSIVAEVSQVVAEASSVVAATYHGANVAQMTELRARARAKGVYLKVIKNTLTRRSFENTDFACMQGGLTGPLVLAFSRQDPSDAAKVLKEFLDDHEGSLQVTMVALPNELLDGTGLKTLASLPSRDEAIAMLMSVMQAPVAKFVRTLAEVPAQFVRVLAALKDTKA